MKLHNMNALFLIGLIGFFSAGSILAVQLYRAFGPAERDIWWTAKTMPLDVGGTADDFELRIDGTLLKDHLAKGTLAVRRGGDSAIAVRPADIAARTNNWHKVRSSILVQALLPSFLFGASCAMMVCGLAGMAAGKR